MRKIRRSVLRLAKALKKRGDIDKAEYKYLKEEIKLLFKIEKKVPGTGIFALETVKRLFEERLSDPQ